MRLLLATGMQLAAGGAFYRAAETVPSAQLDLSSILQTTGFAGLAAVLLLFAKTAYKRETDRADRLETRNADLELSFRTEVIPALNGATTALNANAALITRMEDRWFGRGSADVPPP